MDRRRHQDMATNERGWQVVGPGRPDSVAVQATSAGETTEAGLLPDEPPSPLPALPIPAA